MVKNPSDKAGDVDSIPGLGRFPEGGNSNPLKYTFLENPMDRGAWATVHGVGHDERLISHEDGSYLQALASSWRNLLSGERVQIDLNVFARFILRHLCFSFHAG